MKPYYTKKGRYNDGRQKIIIKEENNPDMILPKPEILKEILKKSRDRDRLSKIEQEKKG